MTNDMIAFLILAVLLVAIATSAYAVICVVTPHRYPATMTSGLAKSEAGGIKTSDGTPRADRDDAELAELLRRRATARRSGLDTPQRSLLRDLLIRQAQDELMEAEERSNEEERPSRAQTS